MLCMISSGKSAMIFRHGSKLINSGLYFPYRIILAAVAFPHGSVIYTVFPRIAHKLAIPYMFISFSRFLYADNLPTTVANYFVNLSSRSFISSLSFLVMNRCIKKPDNFDFCSNQSRALTK